MSRKRSAQTGTLFDFITKPKEAKLEENSEVENFKSVVSSAVPKEEISLEPVPVFENGPFQPQNYNFPRKGGRSFNAKYFEAWPWLSYLPAKDTVLCHVCCEARRLKLLKASNLEPAFLETGFSNWKKATFRFKSHEASECHRDAVFRVSTLKLGSAQRVDVQLNEQSRKEQQIARSALRVSFESV